MTVLITGGAGYIGSHVVKELRSLGRHCIVLDNLERGHAELVLDAELIVGDIADADLLNNLFSRRDIDAVMHFAALAYVGESVSAPERYYRNNVSGTLNLLDCMVRAKVSKLVFSSTCATYGLPEMSIITEDHPQRPINPYGASKLMVEQILRDFGSAYGLRSIALRYFNAAGADVSGRIGEWHDPETHLIPLAIQVAHDRRADLSVYGVDHGTPDGTCIRDYIHVSDLADAHIRALDTLDRGGISDVFNLGNGVGFSVLDVIRSVERVTSRHVRWTPAPRRPGDPPQLIASATKAKELLGWRPQFTDIDAIIETAWRWEKHRST